MKQSILLLGLSASAALANIYFPKVQPTCDSTNLQFSGCLKGQFCQQDNTYVASPRYQGITLRVIDALPQNTHGQCPSRTTARETSLTSSITSSSTKPQLPNTHKMANVVRTMAICCVIPTAQHTKEHAVLLTVSFHAFIPQLCSV